MIQQSQIIDIAEHFHADINGSYSTRSDMTFEPNSLAIVKINRNLLDDTFDIEIPNEMTGNRAMVVTPYVSINNEIIIEGDEAAARSTNYRNKKVFRVHHSMLRNFKFRNVREIIVGTMLGDNVAYMYSIKLDFQDMSNHVDLDEGQVAKISAYKSITVKMNRSLSDPRRLDVGDKALSSVSAEKTQIIYKPTKRKRDDAVTEIAKIYAYTSDDPTQTRGLMPDAKSIIETTGNPKGLSTLLSKQHANENIDVESSAGSTSYNYLYTSLIDTSTYYDYEKMKTSIGFSIDSKQGEFIPFNYHGSYTWIHRLKLWEFIKDFEFRYHENYIHALLDPYDGDIVLNVDNSYASSIHPNKVLSMDSLELIKSNKLISLRGLERISNEKST